MRQTAALTNRLPDKIDVLVLAAGRFDKRRVVTDEGFEQTFAIYVLSRYLLAERLRPALERAEAPLILNLCGTGGIRAGRINWNDLQLADGYSLFKATMQGARANDLLGAGFADAHPESQIRYALYNPLFVNSGMHRQFGQPTRAIVGASAALFGSSTDTSAALLAALLAQPPTAPLTALRRGAPVPLTRPEFDRPAAARLYTLLAELTEPHRV
ncbi:short-chain dehydrogenase [Micromonospora sp. NPDC023888]|uniref:short-chain dehydrogenase n=1 Tax=Micromonospora sp. NPDC023888 TaxID=3155607 RepID=UPI0033DE6FFA